jgi:hypothetical protein
METIEPLELGQASGSPEWSRLPLSSLANSPPQTPTLLQCKRIRRKSSLIQRIGSSEDIPSSHESIFHAERFSSTSSEDNGSGSRPKITLSPIITPIASINIIGNNENIRSQLLAPTIDSTPILYGHGTALTTIVEQKSTTTMCTRVSSANPRSTSEISLAISSTQNLLGYRNSFDLPSTVTLRSPRRRRSFSVDDLVFIKRSYHEACAMIERGTGDSFPIHDIYAGPRTPVLPPIERPATPPGMPSWTAAQNSPVQNTVQPHHWSVTGTQNRLQRFLGIRPSAIKVSSCIPVPVALQHSNQSNQVAEGGRPASSSIPTRIAPRFRPTRSGHGTGPLGSHPFHHAARADAKSDAISTMPGTQTFNPPLSSRPGSPLRSSKRRRLRYPHIVDSLGPNVFASHSIGSVRDEVSPQCPHRQGRQATLQSLNQSTEVVIPDLTVSYTLSTPNESQRDPTHQTIPSTALTEPHVGIEVQATASPVVSPVMTGAIAVMSPTAAPQVKTRPQTHRCWKCHVSTSVSTLDDIWEVSTSWCCWMFCGVDLHEDAEAQSGCAQETLGPRRVVLDGMPVMLY